MLCFFLIWNSGNIIKLSSWSLFLPFRTLRKMERLQAVKCIHFQNYNQQISFYNYDTIELVVIFYLLFHASFLFTFANCFIKPGKPGGFLFGVHYPMCHYIFIRGWLPGKKFPTLFFLKKLNFEFGTQEYWLFFVGVNFRFVFSTKIKGFFSFGFHQSCSG